MRLMARRLVPVGLLVAALAAAGCGSAASAHHAQKPRTIKKSSFVELAAKSGARARAAGSAHITLSMSTRIAGSNQEGVSIRGSGDVSYKPLRESLTVNLTSGVPRLKGTMHEVVTRTKLFMNWPLLSAQIPGHKPWVEEDMSAVGSAMGMNITGLMAQGSTSNPSQMLTYLKGVSTLKLVGHASLGGVATTEYTGTLDYAKLAGKGVISRKMLDMLRTELGGTTVPFKLWLDGNKMVRQMQMDMQVTAPNGPTALVHVQFGFSKFGEKVHIAVPPADQVYNATRMLSSLSSGAGSSS